MNPDTIGTGGTTKPGEGTGDTTPPGEGTGGDSETGEGSDSGNNNMGAASVLDTIMEFE